MRMELTLLHARRACSDDTKFAPLQVEEWTRQHFAITIGDHPSIQRRVKRADVFPEDHVRLAVDPRARFRPLLDQLSRIQGTRVGLRGGRRLARNGSPYPRGIECARKSREETGLQKHFIDVSGIDTSNRLFHHSSDLRFA